MEKKELVTAISKRLKIESTIAEAAVNETIAELAAPFVFKKPGEEAGLILDNSCRNNCKEPAAAAEISTPIRTIKTQ